jgi:hypothetical protein
MEAREQVRNDEVASAKEDELKEMMMLLKEKETDLRKVCSTKYRKLCKTLT